MLAGAGAIDNLTTLALIGAVGLVAGLATLFGGALALRFKDQVPLILGFSAGAVIGVALFDLMPEALILAQMTATPTEILGVVAIGFCGYMFLDRAMTAAAEKRRGHLGPASLTVHSLLDGLGIGLAFQVAPAVGVVVAVAVLAHDVSDGINTVTMSLAGGGGQGRARGWLIADAAAPLVGILATRLFSVSEGVLGLLVALFTGIFLYLGASELVPTSHRTLPRLWTSVATVLGMAVIYVAVRLAEGR
ncbi:MAG: ZIP family metal transporter [Caulobacterales bacterium]